MSKQTLNAGKKSGSSFQELFEGLCGSLVLRNNKPLCIDVYGLNLGWADSSNAVVESLLCSREDTIKMLCFHLKRAQHRMPQVVYMLGKIYARGAAGVERNVVF